MKFLRPIHCLVPVLFLMLVSCTPQRKLVYLQGDAAILKDTTTFEMKLFPGDIISVELFTVNPDAFPGLGISTDRITGTDNRTAYEKGFVLDRNGDVSLPYIGKVHLAGLSLNAAHDTVDQRFRQYIEEPVIVLKKLSFKISVVGEVNRPGLYYIPNEQLTLLEGIALAGDLTNFADRTSVKILRKNGDAIDEIQVDLTQKTAFVGKSKFLHPDDIIYVAPSRKKGFTTISPATAVITSFLTVLILAGTLYIRAD